MKNNMKFTRTVSVCQLCFIKVKNETENIPALSPELLILIKQPVWFLNVTSPAVLTSQTSPDHRYSFHQKKLNVIR